MSGLQSAARRNAGRGRGPSGAGSGRHERDRRSSLVCVVRRAVRARRQALLLLLLLLRRLRRLRLLCVCEARRARDHHHICCSSYGCHVHTGTGNGDVKRRARRLARRRGRKSGAAGTTCPRCRGQRRQRPSPTGLGRRSHSRDRLEHSIHRPRCRRGSASTHLLPLLELLLLPARGRRDQDQRRRLLGRPNLEALRRPTARRRWRGCAWRRDIASAPNSTTP